MRVGFVGLGAMGRAMVGSLLRGGHEVIVWNRSRERVEAARREGAVAAATPAEAAAAGVVFTMLADDAALDAVTSGDDGILAGLPAGGVHLAASTVAPDTIERLARAHSDAGAVLVAAPVLGRPDAAAQGKLAVVAAGDSAAIERARPALDSIAQRVFVVGDDPPVASLMKLTVNFMLTAAIEALAEGFALVRKAGGDPAALLEVLTGSLFAAPAYRTYGQALLEDRFSPPGFKLPLGAKDNRLFLQAGERHDVPLPLASLVRDRMLAAKARGYGGLDWAVFARMSQP